MADEKTFTQADLDKIKAEADARIEAMDKKVQEALDEAKEAKRALRAASEIKPEDLSAAEDRADKAEAKAKELEKQLGTVTKERDTAVKALETEQTVSRNNALDREISDLVAKGAIVPEAVDMAKAYLREGATTEIVDGKIVVKRGDNLMSEFAAEYFASDATKIIRAAPNNSGGGAPGGTSGGSSGGKTITVAEHQEVMKSGDIGAIAALNKSITAKETVVEPAT